MRTLITQTLLSSWLYCWACAEGSEEEAEAEFLRTLRREPQEKNEAMANGIAFENGVYALARDPRAIVKVYPPWNEGTRRIATIIEGGQFQVKVQRDLEVDGEDYLVYGICDAVKAGVIYDVKFSSKPFVSADLAGKYLGSPQHPAYLYCLPEARRFVYLVSDGESLYTEEYARKDTPPIGEVIADFRRDIRTRGLEDIYTQKWEAR